MAINIRGLCRLNISLANNVLFKSNFINAGARTLYTERDLGVTAYENARFVFRNQFVTIEDTFRTKMKEICEKEDGIIYTEDLKAMLHLAHENESDMSLLNSMLEKYVSDKDHRKFGTYAFGPIVMRMYYYLNQPNLALQTFENSALNENFNYRSSFRILMCLLYKHNMFKELREVYDKILSSKGLDFIGRNTVLMYAACMKENTPDSLQYALKHWKEQYDIVKPTVRSCAMVSVLAIKNNAPAAALEILAVVDKERAIAVRCLKILALMSLKNYLQIIPILKHAVEQDDASGRRQFFFADVIYELEERVKTEDIVEANELQSLIDQVKMHELLDTNSTLEEFLLRPMSISRTGGMKTMEKDPRPFVNRNHNTYRPRAEIKSYL